MLMVGVVVAAWLMIGPMFQDADASVDGQKVNLRDYDGDGWRGVSDDCDCTTGKTKRDLSKTYCVADTDPSQFGDLRSYLSENHPALNRTGLIERDGVMYYTPRVCDIAIVEALWPAGFE